MRAVERQLRGVVAPNEPQAEARAWEVARTIYAERSPAPHSRQLRRIWLAPIAAVLAGVLTLTPAGAAVHRWIDRTLGVRHPQPALFSLPSPGQLLVAGRGGAWTVAADGSKRRLGAWTDATWSPHARYIAVARADQLAAVTPRGTIQWSIARPAVRFPRWSAPTGYRLAYLSAGSVRVIAGDGTGDRQLATQVAPVAPAWRPDHPYQLAYVRRDGGLSVRDADTGVVAWFRRLPSQPSMLAWSSDGRRLLVLTTAAAFVYDGSGRLITHITASGLSDGAISPYGGAVALLAAGELTVTEIGRTTHRVFAGSGLRQLAWSPNGQWILATWPPADQWVFVRARGHPRIIAVSRITQQFGSSPSIDGWCCTTGSGAG